MTVCSLSVLSKRVFRFEGRNLFFMFYLCIDNKFQPFIEHHPTSALGKSCIRVLPPVIFFPLFT